VETLVLFIIPGACSFGSQVALEWTKEAYKVGITTAEIRSSEAFRKINPTGKVGALKDGQNVIGENLAILLYLADKFQQNDMCPNVGTQSRARVYQWLSYLSSTLHPAFGQALFPDKFIGGDCATEFKKLATQKLLAVLEYINRSFCTSGYLIENKPTIVDAQAYGLLRWGRGYKGSTPVIDLNKFPNIMEFLKLMEDNQAVQNALAIETGQSVNLVNSKFAGYFNFGS
jgi:glutathione S-transferase